MAYDGMQFRDPPMHHDNDEQQRGWEWTASHVVRSRSKPPPRTLRSAPSSVVDPSSYAPMQSTASVKFGDVL
ncbi:unnamed protein product [Triticum turgidum subsp. durum]|uniref:Uncharacterized protein n=2 Tax=Triticum TaxID=4564 RepID=A0A9R0WMH4_TRITD|nr:unnamed protein product [Triticum turgidum subsp. durum]